LYRGIESVAPEEFDTWSEYNDYVKDIESSINERGFVSYTSDIKVARDFAGSDGEIIKEDVSIDDIMFSSDYQDFGNFGENEYIVRY